MIEDLTTEEVKDFIEADKRIFLRINIASDNDFNFTKARSILKGLDEADKDNELDIIIYSTNAVVQTRVSYDERKSKAKTAENVINHLHLDYIPYTELIVSLTKTEENEKLLKDICTRCGMIA